MFIYVTENVLKSIIHCLNIEFLKKLHLWFIYVTENVLKSIIHCLNIEFKNYICGLKYVINYHCYGNHYACDT